MQRVKLLPFEQFAWRQLPDAAFDPMFTSAEDELVIEQTVLGKMVNALVGDCWHSSQNRFRVMNLRLNQFSGHITISWHDHQVREVKPEGALRSIKKTL